MRTDSGTSSLSVKPTSIVIRRGASADVTVDLARGSDVTGTVTAASPGLPGGVTAAPSPRWLRRRPPPSSNSRRRERHARSGDHHAECRRQPAGASADPAPRRRRRRLARRHLRCRRARVGSVARRRLDVPRGRRADRPEDRRRRRAAAEAHAPNGWIIRRYAANGVPDTAFNTATSDGRRSARRRAGSRASRSTPRGTSCAGFSAARPHRGGSSPSCASFRRARSTRRSAARHRPHRLLRHRPPPRPGSHRRAGRRSDRGGRLVARPRRRGRVGIVTRFLENGARDTTFNGGATIVVAGTRFRRRGERHRRASSSPAATGGPLPSYFATRRTAQGVLDTTFGTGGTAAFGNTAPNAFARLADGRSRSSGDATGDRGLHRRASRAPKGAAVFARAYGNAPGAGFFGIAVQADGQIIAAGHTAVANGEGRVQRILPDGNKDIHVRGPPASPPSRRRERRTASR